MKAARPLNVQCLHLDSTWVFNEAENSTSAIGESRIGSQCLMDSITPWTWKRTTNSRNKEEEHKLCHALLFREETFEEFEDLKVIFERNLATGKSAIGLGDTTDARTTRIGETEKEQTNYGEDISFNVQENYEPQSSFFCSPSNNSLEKLPLRKRQKTSSLHKADDPFIQKEGAEEASTEINALTTVTQKLFNLIEERETRQKQEAEQREVEKKKNNLWEAIKEVSDLEEHVRFDAVKMIHQLGMKDVFISMSIEERCGWIKHNVIGS
ncbi:unnamed protein product [Eruca vesicaria subsp. sativa]|uniref:At2g29880-like C-terminal domain-containing protein n=1 Tax=Eruca vesicaria subsp. sativa TaxID=29727 RepID=A0ABC8LQN6_ERUVS|nr:unnamed protein product [Eruca vesicaria subsp. sativa]